MYDEVHEHIYVKHRHPNHCFTFWSLFEIIDYSDMVGNGQIKEFIQLNE